MKRSCLAFVLICAACVMAFAVNSVSLVDQSAILFQTIMNAPDKGIDVALLDRARCVVIVPSVQGAGRVYGARYGLGLAMCRPPNGLGWTAPSAVKIDGGLFGKQIISGESDLIILVMTDESAYRLLKSPLTLGGPGTLAAGPSGQCGYDTGAFRCAEIVAYSRLQGMFTDVALKGSMLRPIDESNEVLYGRKVSHEDILMGRIPAPPAARPLVNTVTMYSPARGQR
ncbi:MAG TPA: lipid-binding SYLF domain-containing protein [Terriglobia bacterium]|nr:lipid-binding SYLF domain-containing protein [Terriglobia bacterium]